MFTKIFEQKREAIINGFIYLNFYLNRYLALFLFKYSNKIEKIQKRFLAIVLNNNKCYYKVLLEKLYINNMNMIKMKSLAIQIFRNIINLITSCMKDLYQKRNPRIRPNNIIFKDFENGVVFTSFLIAIPVWNK